MNGGIKFLSFLVLLLLIDLAAAFSFSKSATENVVTPADVAEYNVVENDAEVKKHWLAFKSKELRIPVPVLEADMGALKKKFQKQGGLESGEPLVESGEPVLEAVKPVLESDAPVIENKGVEASSSSSWWRSKPAVAVPVAVGTGEVVEEVVEEAVENGQTPQKSWWSSYTSKDKSGSSEMVGAVPPEGQMVGTTSVSSAFGPDYSVPTLLKNIYVSVGELSPPFAPEINSYVLELNQPHDQLAVVPEIMHDDLSFINEADMPIVHMTWKGNKDAFPETASIAMRKQIDLPDTGKNLKIKINVADPHNPKNFNTYQIKVLQTVPPLAMLKFMDGVDNYGDSVLVDPVPSQDTYIYNVCVNPTASKITLLPGCTTGSSLTIKGSLHKNGTPFSINRETDHHAQVLEVTCSGVATEGSRYALLVKSDWLAAEIPVPRLIVDNIGKECLFDTEKQKFSCPNPKSEDGKVRMVAYNEPSIKYTIENSKKTTEVRLLNNVQTIPFTYASGLKVVAEGCQYTREWPITYGGHSAPGLMQLLGWILAISLAVLLATLLILIGATSMCGIGVPIGGTEIAATMTLIVQYFCFANFMRGSTMLTEMIFPLKWVTLFWPLPWHGDNLFKRSMLDSQVYASAFGLELWGDSSLGDVTDIRNACGCLFWCLCIFLVLLMIHAGAYVKFMVFEKDHTFPHRVKIGNWESRCLHWLAFPNATASAMIIASDITTLVWKCLAGLSLTIYVCWVCIVLFTVHTAVSNEHVAWVWNSSVREDGELEDESGYWSDVICDQLVTQPVNRGLCKGFFPFKWVSTVADIEPVSLSQSVYERGQPGDVYPPAQYPHAQREALYPLAKNPKAVEVTTARAPCGLCKGSRLPAGLFRTQWLDTLFTYQGLAKVHDQMVKDTGRHVIVPLTVKTCQLSGPLASGGNAFFFDGTRVPFIRIADSIFRILIGVFIGVALASPGYKTDAVMFSCTCLVAAALCAYVAVTRPYSRTYENWMIVGAMAVISLSACSFSFYAFMKREPSCVADVFLWVVALGCFALAAYACFVSVSVFSALICPPLEESRFLEKLANCNCTVSDHNEGWSVDMPAYSKYPVRDIRAQCTLSKNRNIHVSIMPSGEEASFEFSVSEIRRACRTGMITPPVLVLFAPTGESALGYRQMNITDRTRVSVETEKFLSEDPALYSVSEALAVQIAEHMNSKGRNSKTILSVSIVPPRGMDHSSISYTTKSSSKRSSVTGTSQSRGRSGKTATTSSSGTSRSSSSSYSTSNRSRSKSTSRVH